MTTHKKLVLLVAGLIICACIHGQQFPSKPISYPFFSPLVFNPAITGSIDYTSVNLISRMNSAPGAQMAAMNTRLLRAGGSSGAALSNLGVGGYLFHDKLPGARDLGVGISTAYHVPLGTSNNSGLSFGIAAKGLYHLVTDAGESVGSANTSFIPNADLGLYYYGSYGFAGISSVNMLGLFSDSLSAGDYTIPSEHLFYGGLKFVLSRKNGVILEPSLLVSLNDSLLSNPWNSAVPYLKLHVQNASIGTFFKNLDNLVFFLQYHFPRFYTGLFIEYPLNEMLITGDQVNVELSFGLSLGKNKELATVLSIPPPLFASGKEQTGQEKELAAADPQPTSEKADAGKVKKKPAREKQAKAERAKQTEVKEELVEVEEQLTETEEELVEVKQELKETREELTEAREEITEVKTEEPAAEPATEAQAAKVEKQEEMEEEEKVEQQEEKDVVIFRVQITSSVKPTAGKQVVIDGKPYEPFEYFYVGAYRQCIGNFRDLDDATALKNRCRAAGYNQAFVAAFINDERITDPGVFRR